MSIYPTIERKWCKKKSSFFPSILVFSSSPSGITVARQNLSDNPIYTDTKNERWEVHNKCNCQHLLPVPHKLTHSHRKKLGMGKSHHIMCYVLPSDIFPDITSSVFFRDPTCLYYGTHTHTLFVTLIFKLLAVSTTTTNVIFHRYRVYQSTRQHSGRIIIILYTACLCLNKVAE